MLRRAARVNTGTTMALPLSTPMSMEGANRGFMGRYLARGQQTYGSVSIQDAIQRGLCWDVFVSHKSNDTPIALNVAYAIQSPVCQRGWMQPTRP